MTLLEVFFFQMEKEFTIFPKVVADSGINNNKKSNTIICNIIIY